MYLCYDRKNGVEYGKVCCSHWVDGKDRKTYINLGRVIDKQNHIFKTVSEDCFAMIQNRIYILMWMKASIHPVL